MEAQSRIGTIADHLKQYVDTKSKLYLLDAANKTSSTVSSLGFSILMTVAILFVMLFLSFGAAIWINHTFGETSMGFFIIGLFYVLVSCVLFIARDSLVKTPIYNFVLKLFYSDEKD